MGKFRSVFITALAAFLVTVKPAFGQEKAYTSSWAVQITGGAEKADEIAEKYGFENLGLIGGLNDMYHFKMKEELMDITANPFDKESSVIFSERQFTQPRVMKSYTTQDDKRKFPEFRQLQPGHGLRVEQAWMQGWTGCNVSVAVVDDGAQVTHSLLWDNFDPSITFDFANSNETKEDTDPTQNIPRHGTGSAGIIAAVINDNDSCSVGIAYESNLGALQIFTGLKDPYKITEEKISSMVEAEALGYKKDSIDIYSNGWGPSDNGSQVSGPSQLTKRAMKNGVDMGRNGKGSIYVWANGNGGEYDDCAADGYASSIYTISVGGIELSGDATNFDEQCSAKLVVAYSTKIKTLTIDNECTDMFGGEQNGGASASAAQVSGIIALALDANPNLTWRDVQYLIAYTANPNLTAGPVTRNGAGLAVSRQFGFGVMDAEAMVIAAKDWVNVPEQIIDPLVSSGNATNSTPSIVKESYSGPILYMEHIVVTMTVETANDTKQEMRGDITIDLVSPTGTRSILLGSRLLDEDPGGYYDWPFMSVMFWGEDPTGEWTLTIRSQSNSTTIAVSDIEFTFYGVSSTPDAVANIPDECHPDCNLSRGCIGRNSTQCYSCAKLRDAHTLECIDKCPSEYTKDGYCYNTSIPLDECKSPRKDKIENGCRINNGGCKDRCKYKNYFMEFECYCEDEGYELVNDTLCTDIDECLGSDHGCEEVCVNTNGSYICNCSDGFELNDDGRSCDDINECLCSDHGCQQWCNNTDGSYICSCDAGYELNDNGKTCDGPNVCDPQQTSTESYLQLFVLNSQYNATNMNLSGDDEISKPIPVMQNFPIGCTSAPSVRIGTNGYFTFKYFIGFTPFPFKRGNGLSLVAPFFTNIELPTGSVEYEVHTNNSINIATAINRRISNTPNTTFCGEWFLIASWKKGEDIMFQGILATDYYRSFAVFTYNCNGNGVLSNKEATIGVVSEDGFIVGNHPSDRLCRNYPETHQDNIVYKLSVDNKDCSTPVDLCLC